MELLFVAYPKCSTCQKARRYLEERGVSFVMRDIKEERPTTQELEQWHKASGLPLKRFVNTSGLLYRSMDLKNKLPAMTEDEIYALLATDGMLVKRPLLIGEGFVLTGFRQGEWDAALSKD
ncbi:MAG: arsenate reductase family protein [Clostridiales bacterium]|nr:arsenate reductase family protein [Clostridiales bacterium]